MRLIVLAAGVGNRMGALGRKTPKCLIPLCDGTTLLQRLMEAVQAAGMIREVLIVGGFKVEQIEQAVLRMDTPFPIRVLTNPFYARAGPLASLWVAVPWAQDADFMACNGDTYYGPATLAKLANEQAGIALGVDTSARHRRSDSVAVVAMAPGILQHAGKEIPYDQAHSVSTGLVAVHGQRARLAFRSALNALLRTREGLRRSTIWHTVLNRLAEQGEPIHLVAVDPTDWHEIDSPEDIHALGIAGPTSQKRPGDPSAPR